MIVLVEYRKGNTVLQWETYVAVEMSVVGREQKVGWS
jgi:hypothetical protein